MFRFPSPNRKDRINVQGGLDVIAAKQGKWYIKEGLYELPATPIAEPEVTVEDSDVLAGASILVCLAGNGECTFVAPLVPKSEDVDTGEFKFTIQTNGDKPNKDIPYVYIIVNPS